MMAVCLLGLGANLGDPTHQLSMAVEELKVQPNLSNVVVSSLHTTEPIGGPEDQAAYVNAAVRAETRLEAQPLLQCLQQIERRLGRTPSARWAPRTIDLDLLLLGNAIIDTRQLQVPHPALAARRFVLEPAAEVAAGMVHPQLGWSIERLRDHLRQAPSRFAITGFGNHRPFIQSLSEQLQTQVIVDPNRATRSVPRAENDPRRLLSHLEQQVDRQVAALEDGGWMDSAHSRLTISGFWLPQTLDWARRHLPPDVGDEFAAGYQARVSTLPDPKIVICGPMSDGAEQRAVDMGRYPYVKVRSQDPADWLRETAGAVVAS